MKLLKIGMYDMIAAGIILCATALRVVLDALGWPPTNADEGTMGIMALHIAYRGERPLLFYGQNYMGSLEAYLGAIFFHLFGPSLFSLRLGVILLTMLFFVSTYCLTSVLYSKQLAVVTLAVLSFGSIQVFSREMLATGGSTQTLLFGSLAFLGATVLALTRRPSTSMPIAMQAWRMLGYFCWGAVLGLAMWSDMVVLPFLAMAGLLLLVCCWRDLLWAWSFILAGIIAGMYPLLLYNVQSIRGSQGQGINSLITLLALFRGSTTQAPHTLSGILYGFWNTLTVSLPIATGNPFCPVEELPWLGDNVAQTRSCVLGHALWGVGYVLLLLCAIVMTLWLLRVARREGVPLPVVFARLAMQFAALLAIVAYALSSAPMGWPGFHARYLVGLLIITPVVLAPLWRVSPTLQRRPRPYGRIASCVVLAAIFGVLLMGTGILLGEVPAAQAAHQRESALIQGLLRRGITHVYTDYWSCDNLAFLSNEQVICGVIDGNLQFSHNRDPRYAALVGSDPRSAYVLPVGAGQLQAVEQKVAKFPGKYHRYTLAGYVVYQPI